MKQTEKEQQEEFIKAVGGQKNADRLQRIYNDSYPHYKDTFRDWTKTEVFIQNAKGAGFTDKMINLFLML